MYMLALSTCTYTYTPWSTKSCIDLFPCRTVNLSVLESPWMTSLLCTLGFLPQAKLLYLPPDYLDLLLLSTALAVINGVELAVTRGAIPVETR